MACLCGTAITRHMYAELRSRIENLASIPEAELEESTRAILLVLGLLVESYEEEAEAAT